MALDPAFQPLLDLLDSLPDMATLDAPALRAQLDQFGGPAEVADMAEVITIDIPGPAGAIPAQLYRPHTATDGGPALLWLHGGGWALGSVERGDPTIRSVADACGALTLAIDYRLAPEHPFPAAVDDCWAALEWLAAHAAEHGASADRLAVAGDSAGANLSAVVCLMAREKDGPRVGFQGLIYPVTTFDFDTPSYLANGKGYFLTRALVERLADWYLPADQRNDWRAAPLAATDLSGLPPALVITAEYDPLRDDGAVYARRLAEAGGAVEHLDFEGMIHGFFSMPELVPQAVDAQQALARAMRAALT